MSPGGSNLEGAFRTFLSFDVSKIERDIVSIPCCVTPL